MNFSSLVKTRVGGRARLDGCGGPSRRRPILERSLFVSKKSDPLPEQNEVRQNGGINPLLKSSEFYLLNFVVRLRWKAPFWSRFHLSDFQEWKHLLFARLLPWSGSYGTM